jgi:hypothetical protein
MSGSKAVLVAMLAFAACKDFHLSASNLDIGPDPAVPGDIVVASFFLGLVPVQRHTVIVMIDNEEHLRVTSNEAPPIPYEITLGDAADLIAEYGVGTHSVFIIVRAEEKGETARTRSVGFELQQPAP